MKKKGKAKKGNTFPHVEENGIILDFLPLGRVNQKTSQFNGNPVAQVIGTNKFTLLEITPKKGQQFELQEEVYLGRGHRDKVHRVIKNLSYDDLSQTAKVEVEYTIRDIIMNNEEKYVGFFNNSGSITRRLHEIALLPGVGEKHTWDILKAREEKPFESFEDITQRITLLTDPVGQITERVLYELGKKKTANQRKDTHYIFTKPPEKYKDHRSKIIRK